mmetsp:Transcript_43192/g.93120  ORF Transcript_43192/g.93120 Transcript_43192/m.93120 type:complete len:1169 (+) Transcript_43192:156-3662(+)
MSEAGGDDNMEDLFGDFQSEDDAGMEEAPASTKRPLEGSSAAASSTSKRARKAAESNDATRFFELEAEEAGDASDDEDEADLEGLVDNAEMSGKQKSKDRSALQRAANAELDELAADMASRGPEVGARRVFGRANLDRMQEKYAAMELAGEDHAEHRPLRSAALSSLPKVVEERQVVPLPQDPKLWRCKTFADERQLCVSLMLKASEWLQQGKDVPISTVFYTNHQRGYLYVEAFREAEVRDFARGIRGISPWNIVVVPTAQMPLVFSSTIMDSTFIARAKVGDYVRIRRKPFTGDLGQIEEILDDEYTVKLKPRISYKSELTSTANEKDGRIGQKRAVARWFNKADLEATGVVNTQMRATAKGTLAFYFYNEDLYRDGFLYKSFKLSALDTGDQVRPQEHELQDWSNRPPIDINTRPAEDLDREELDKKLMPPPVLPEKVVQAENPYAVGDIVIVSSGELRNLLGRVVNVIYRSPTITVRPLEEGLQDLELATSTLCKYFEKGDYVKVLAGQNGGETGYVLSVDYAGGQPWNSESKAVVLKENMTGEVKVRLDLLRLTAEKPDMVMEKDGFRVGQLVGLHGNAARGVIVVLRGNGAGSAGVLKSDGHRSYFALAELTPLPRNQTGSKSFTLDKDGRRIAKGSIVKAPRSTVKAAPIAAEVLFVHGDRVFIQASELTGDASFMVVPGRRVELVYHAADLAAMEGRGGKEKASPAAKKEDVQEEAAGPTILGTQIQMASNTDWLKDKQFGAAPAPVGGLQEGASVKILRGDYRGLRAEVKKNMGEKVLLSLLAKPKLVSVKIEYVQGDVLSENPWAEFLEQKSAAVTPNLQTAPMTPLPGALPRSGPLAKATPSQAAAAAAATGAGSEELAGTATATATATEAAGTPSSKKPDKDALLNPDNSWDPDFMLEDAISSLTPPAPVPEEPPSSGLNDGDEDMEDGNQGKSWNSWNNTWSNDKDWKDKRSNWYDKDSTGNEWNTEAAGGDGDGWNNNGEDAGGAGDDNQHASPSWGQTAQTAGSAQTDESPDNIDWNAALESGEGIRFAEGPINPAASSAAPAAPVFNGAMAPPADLEEAAEGSISFTKFEAEDSREVEAAGKESAAAASSSTAAAVEPARTVLLPKKEEATQDTYQDEDEEPLLPPPSPASSVASSQRKKRAGLLPVLQPDK